MQNADIWALETDQIGYYSVDYNYFPILYYIPALLKSRNQYTLWHPITPHILLSMFNLIILGASLIHADKSVPGTQQDFVYKTWNQTN